MTMIPTISKAKITYIRTVQTKKGREKSQSFLVEGPKLAAEALAAAALGCCEIELLAALPSWFEEQDSIRLPVGLCYSLNEKQLAQCSALKQSNQVLLLIKQFAYSPPEELEAGQLMLGLDDLQDPGNLGSIIRLADWFGIRHIFCTKASADFYNPKVIQATMGSFLRVQVHRLDLEAYIKRQGALHCYGALLDAPSMYDLPAAPTKKARMLLIGNESKGLSAPIQALVQEPLSIPRIGQAESLNAALATSIILAHLHRMGFSQV